MSGFPSRILRSVLGPVFRDVRPVEHPEREISAEAGNLIANIATAANLLMPRVSLVAEYSGSGSIMTVLHQEQAWNVDHLRLNPALARTGTGVYTYTFAAAYLDKDGVSVPTTIIAARVAAVSLTLEATCELTSAYVVTVNVKARAGGSATDGRFWLEVL